MPWAATDYFIHESIVNRNLISFHNVMDDMLHWTQYSLVAVGGSFNSRSLYRIAYHRAFYYVVPESHKQSVTPLLVAFMEDSFQILFMSPVRPNVLRW